MQSHADIHDSVTGCTHLICADKTALCTTIITKLYKPGDYTNVHTQHLQHDYYSTNTTVTSAPAPGHYTSPAIAIRSSGGSCSGGKWKLSSCMQLLQYLLHSLAPGIISSGTHSFMACCMVMQSASMEWISRLRGGECNKQLGKQVAS